MRKRMLVALTAATLGMALVQGPIANAEPEIPTCQGEVATIFIPTTRDTVTAVEGTDADDVIVTGDGPDSVDGNGGSDLICTRGGPDSIRGGSGDDRVNGGEGADRLRGNLGLDRANGGGGTQDVCAAERERACEANFGD